MKSGAVFTALIILFIQWEPGFNGGFDQHFETRIKDVTTGQVTTGESHGPLVDISLNLVLCRILPADLPGPPHEVGLPEHQRGPGQQVLLRREGQQRPGRVALRCSPASK